MAAASASRTEINSSTCDFLSGKRKPNRLQRNRRKRRKSLTLFLSVSAARLRQHLSSTEEPVVAPLVLEKGEARKLHDLHDLPRPSRSRGCVRVASFLNGIFDTPVRRILRTDLGVRKASDAFLASKRRRAAAVAKL